MLAAIEGRIARGLAGLDEKKAQALTVAELCERFLIEYSRPRIKNLARYRQYAATALRRVLPLLSTLRADAVAAKDVARARDALLRRHAVNSVRTSLAALGTAYGWAVAAGLAEHNPLRGLELPQRQESIDYLDADEVRRLLAEAAQQAEAGALSDRCLRACVTMALYTGMRKGELFALRWRDLDLHSGRLTVARSFDGATKNGRTRHLRLPDAVTPILAAWQRECPKTETGLLFPRKQRDGTWSMVARSNDMLGLDALLVAARCRPIARAWHVLRHTFASHYMMAGGSLLALSKILGHSDVKITMVYAHLAPDFIGSEMNRIKF